MVVDGFSWSLTRHLVYCKACLHYEVESDRFPILSWLVTGEFQSLVGGRSWTWPAWYLISRWVWVGMVIHVLKLDCFSFCWFLRISWFLATLGALKRGRTWISITVLVGCRSYMKQLNMPLGLLKSWFSFWIGVVSTTNASLEWLSWL